jgi:hypothetical protein
MELVEADRTYISLMILVEVMQNIVHVNGCVHVLFDLYLDLRDNVTFFAWSHTMCSICISIPSAPPAAASQMTRNMCNNSARLSVGPLCSHTDHRRDTNELLPAEDSSCKLVPAGLMHAYHMCCFSTQSTCSQHPRSVLWSDAERSEFVRL